MNTKPSNKVLSFLIIVIALVFSIVIVFNKNTSTTSKDFAKNLIIGDRINIPENNSWQEEILSIGLKSNTGTSSISETPSTVTDSLSISLVSNYLALKQNDVLNNNTAQTLVDQTVDYVDSTTNLSINAPKLNVIENNGKITIYNYGEALGSIIKKHKQKESKNELMILQEIVESRDSKKIEEFEKAIVVYGQLLKDLIDVQVPKAFIKSHTDTIIGMQAIISGLMDMKLILTDPLKGMQGVQKYQQGGVLFLDSTGATIQFIKQNNIIYKQGSGGYYLLYGI